MPRKQRRARRHGPGTASPEHRGGCRTPREGVTELWSGEGGVGGPLLVTRGCHPLRPRVSLQALPAALSLPALPIWDVPARIRLLPGESCYLPSNLFGGFSGDGTSAGWGRGGMEALWAVAGAGNEAQPGIGAVPPRDPLWSAASPSLKSGITQGAGDTLCHLRAGSGASVGQQRGQGPLHNPVCSCHDSSRGWRRPEPRLCSRQDFTLHQLLHQGLLAHRGDSRQLSPL